VEDEVDLLKEEEEHAKSEESQEYDEKITVEVKKVEESEAEEVDEKKEEQKQPEPDEEKLPEVYPPYLPRKEIMESPYTLVLDLDETLIHFNSANDNQENGETGKLIDLEEGENDFFYMVRPFCNKFLNELSSHFELVIFTAALQDYADWIVDGID